MILSGRDSVTPQPVAVWGWRGIGAFLTALVVLFSWFVATFPGEAEHDLLAKWDASGRAVSLRNQIFQSDVDGTTRRRVLPLSNTLVLTGFNIYEGLNIDDPDKVKGRDFVFRARGRNLRGAIFDLATLPKVDFEGADLRNASLFRAQLQDSSLEYAQLQNARLDWAQLQGVWLGGAQLQGASLGGAQLQGASLDGAQLQGALVDGAELQGAILEGTGLQGASLVGAHLEGASLLQASLQGASLQLASLHGASLQQAHLRATDLSTSHLWRTVGLASPVAAIRMLDSPDQWLPIWKDGDGKAQLWNDRAYQSLPRPKHPFPWRGGSVMDRISSLDCANPDPALASCDPSVPPPPEVAAWRKSLEDARVDDAAYAKALATELRMLVCSGGNDAAYVLRGLASNHRLAATGSEAPTLVEAIMSKDCPVSASLTEADKARLLTIKQDALKKPGG
jgi:uncharacterized protein YjbI with pentapeptide repeats